MDWGVPGRVGQVVLMVAPMYVNAVEYRFESYLDY